MYMLSRLVAWFRRPRHVVAFVLGCTLVVGVWSLVRAELIGPRPYDRHITIAVKSLLTSEHLSRHPLDDEISQRAFKSFFKTLDPMKLYFYQSDIDEFARRQNELDDMIANKDISFAYTVYQRFLVRVDERLKTVEELIKQPHEFTRDDVLVTDPDKLRHPQTPEEARERWERRVKYDLLVLKLDKKEGTEARDRLQRRYQSLAKRLHQTDADELLEMFLTSVTASYDPHTTYMSPSTLENFRIIMKLELEGIGAALQVVDGYTVVSKVIPGGAADKHGKLKSDDRIVSVGQGETGEMVDVIDMKLNDVVAMIRGKAGTVVRLGVLPVGGKESQVYNITRAKIELKDSEAHGEIIEQAPLPLTEAKPQPAGKANATLQDPPAPVAEGVAPRHDGAGPPVRIGWLDLPSFYMDMEGARRGVDDYRSTTRDVRKILEDFTAKRADAVVLDLRHNGGGSLTEAISLTGLFIDTGPVVQVKDSDGRVQQYDDNERGMAWNGPLVVLTSKFSASASEILAGAIQDYQRGLIVGDSSTHGKGTVQSLMDLGQQIFRVPHPPADMGALKITMQQFYRPNGDSTQKRGVLSDLKLPSISDNMDVSESDLDYAIAFDRVPPVRYPRQVMVAPEVVQALAARSQSRVGQSSDFAKLLRNIERYKTQKAKKVVPLKESEFFAERADLDADKEEEKQLEEQNQQKEKTIRRDFYFKEVMAITADYVKLLERNRVAQAR